MLAVLAGLLVWVFDASTSRLIQLYIIGVFVSFTLSQAGMVRHWTRALGAQRDPAVRRRTSTSPARTTRRSWSSRRARPARPRACR